MTVKDFELRDVLAVDAHSSADRLALAAEILANGAGVVMLEENIALRRVGTHLYCEVVDPTPRMRRCANEFEVLVENAQRVLASSRLQERLPDLPRRWRVVEDCGTGTVELWRAP